MKKKKAELWVKRIGTVYTFYELYKNISAGTFSDFIPVSVIHRLTAFKLKPGQIKKVKCIRIEVEK